MFPILLAAAAVFAWLVATWYFADDEPLFGHASAERITFKQVICNVFCDIAEVTRPAWMWLWLNAPFAAQVAANGVILMDETLRTTVFGHFWGAVALVAANLLARYGSTAAHAPIPRRAPTPANSAPVNPHGGAHAA